MIDFELSANAQLIDLSSYESEPLPARLGGRAGLQYVIRDQQAEKRIATSYLHPAFAIAENVYSKLSAILGLDCVKACYATSSNLSVGKPFISASEFSAEWIPLDVWNAEWPDHSINNVTQIGEHGVLAALDQSVFEEAQSGFVTRNGRYIKANNGMALFALGLMARFERQESQINHTAPFDFDTFLQDSERFQSGMGIVAPCAELTNDQIDDCLVMPTWPLKEIAHDHMLIQLLNIRNAAQVVQRRKA